MKQNISYLRRSSRDKVSPRNNRNNGRTNTPHEGTQVVDGKTKAQLAQVMDKHLGLARDAQTGGDRVAAEGHYQHADHYYRLLSVSHESPESTPSKHSAFSTYEAEISGSRDRGREKRESSAPPMETPPLDTLPMETPSQGPIADLGANSGDGESLNHQWQNFVYGVS